MEHLNEETMQAPLTAQAISDELMEENLTQEAQEAEELAASIREGIGMLFEDGWTSEELSALSQDAGVRLDVAKGKDLIRAAAAYLRRLLLAEQNAHAMPRRRSVPVTRSSAAGNVPQDNRIEAMSDAQFDAFSRQARAAAMMGRKVKM